MRFEQLVLWATLGVTACAVGCGSSSSTGTSGGTTTTTGTYSGPKVYVINQFPFATTSQQILEFALTANGSSTPVAAITSENNTTGFNFLSSDTSGNIYTWATTTGLDIRAYAQGTTGISTGARNVQLGNTIYNGTFYAAASPAGEIFATGVNAGLQVFSSAASGTATPARSILGAYSLTPGTASMIQDPYAVAADSSGTAYVLNRVGTTGAIALTAPILIFSSTATGNVAPTRTIGGALTTINTLNSIAVDSSGNIWVTDNLGYTARILEFAAGSNGNVAPTRIIAGSATTFGVLYGIQVDSSGQVFVVSEPGNNQQTPYVLRFAAGATGNVAPASSFNSPQWTQTDAAGGLAVY